MAYSTIRQKYGSCQHPGCKTYGPLTKKLCGIHYWQSVKIKSVTKLEEKEVQANESLSTVIEDLDVVFSQFIRLRDSDENGYVICPCCGDRNYWTDCDNMHFIPRAHMITRFSEENCYGGCVDCNRALSGNLRAYGEYLESIRPGSVEILEEQATIIYRYSVSELKGLISHYSSLVKSMRKTKPLKP